MSRLKKCLKILFRHSLLQNTVVKAFLNLTLRNFLIVCIHVIIFSICKQKKSWQVIQQNHLLIIQQIHVITVKYAQSTLTHIIICTKW